MGPHDQVSDARDHLLPAMRLGLESRLDGAGADGDVQGRTRLGDAHTRHHRRRVRRARPGGAYLVTQGRGTFPRYQGVEAPRARPHRARPLAWPYGRNVAPSSRHPGIMSLRSGKLAARFSQSMTPILCRLRPQTKVSQAEAVVLSR